MEDGSCWPFNKVVMVACACASDDCNCWMRACKVLLVSSKESCRFVNSETWFAKESNNTFFLLRLALAEERFIANRRSRLTLDIPGLKSEASASAVKLASHLAEESSNSAFRLVPEALSTAVVLVSSGLGTFVASFLSSLVIAAGASIKTSFMMADVVFVLL